MRLFHCILTLMYDLFQRENLVFKPTSLLVLLHCRVGKDLRPAQSFPPPKCSYLILSPLQNVWIFQFIVQSFVLCYSLTVSEQF